MTKLKCLNQTKNKSKIMEAVTKWLNQFRSPQTNEKEVDNVFIPNEGRSTLRIAKTIVPECRGSFNETFENAKRELDKLKFNK